jgi:hypothetical protein
MKPRYYPVFIIACLCMFIGTYETHAQYSEGGVPICTAVRHQDSHHILSDGAGGAFIAWDDTRNVGTDIYCQHIDTSGYALWTVNGVAVCTDSSFQAMRRLMPDDLGGVIIAWADGRNDSRTYAQRLDGDGNCMWTENGIEIAPDGDSDLCLTNEGTVILAWRDRRNDGGDIYAQKIDVSGNLLWAAGGIPVCVEDRYQIKPQVIPEGPGGAIIVWADATSGGLGLLYENDIFAQRVNSSGELQWPPAGAPVCTADQQQKAFKIASNDSGGVLVAWYDERFLRDLFAQRIDGDGNARWIINGVPLCTACDPDVFSQIVPDGSGGMFISWTDTRNGLGNIDLCAQRVSADGLLMWGDDGDVVCDAPSNQRDPSMFSDGALGVIVSWADQRGDDYDIYTQHISSAGDMLWELNGKPVCTEPGSQSSPMCAGDGVGGVILAWLHMVGTPNIDIYAGRVNPDGDVVVPAILLNWHAYTDGSGIHIEWILSEAAEHSDFTVFRAEVNIGSYTKIDDPDIERNDLVYRFTDESAEPGKRYYYKVLLVKGESSRLLVETDVVSLPGVAPELYQNYPNPFNPNTTISYALPDKAHTTLSIYTVEGKLVRLLVNETLAAGYKQIIWDGRDNHGIPLSSGVYVYRLKAGSNALTKKMILLK